MAEAAQKMLTCPQFIYITLQVVLTTIDPSRMRQDLSYDAYEYTVCFLMCWLLLLLCMITSVLPIPQMSS